MVISTLAGSSSGTSGNQANVILSSTRFNGPRGLRVLGAKIYICDTMNNGIKVINLDSMMSEYYAGGLGQGDDTNMVATNANLKHPSNLDIYKNRLYFSDRDNSKVKRITLLDAYLTTITSTVAFVSGIAIHKGYGYMTGNFDFAVYDLALVTGAVSLFVGSTTSGDSNTYGSERFLGISTIYADCLRKTLVIHDYTADKAKRYSFLQGGVVTELVNQSVVLGKGANGMA